MKWLLLVFLIISGFSIENIKNSFSEFIKTVEDDFHNTWQTKYEEQNEQKQQIQKNYKLNSNDIKIFDFKEDLYEKYMAFAHDRYEKKDYIDAYYFQKRAEKLKKYKYISPANPIAFGILPEDIWQFLDARKRLKDVSIPSIIDSTDGVILSDAFISYDCWLEAFENNIDLKRAKRCRNRFIDDIKALELSLFNKGLINSNLVNKNSLASIKYDSCKICDLIKKGYMCNAIYFENGSSAINGKSRLVFRRIQQKLLDSYMKSILIGYYNIPNLDQELIDNRQLALLNLIQKEVLKTDEYINSSVKISKLDFKKNFNNIENFINAIIICIE